MMIRPLLLFFILFSTLLSYGQDSINKTDHGGRRQGNWIKRDKEGHKLYDGQFSDGVPYGIFRYYYPNGKVKAISVMSENGKLARTVSFSVNGRKIAEGNFRNEKKDSIWNYFSELDGVLLSCESYLEGEKIGRSATFYPNGNIAELINFSSGKKAGEWIQYYDDGRVRFQGYYAADEKEGQFKAYYPDGKLSISGAYKAGHKDGTWTFYDEKGGIINSEKYWEGAVIKEKTQ